MEKFNLESDCSSSLSDTDSLDQENSFLFNFIFEKRLQGKNPTKDPSNVITLNVPKDESKLNAKDCSKIGRPNGRTKKQASAVKKDTESPYRKVLVTTDLRSDVKSRRRRVTRGGGGQSCIFGLIDWDLAQAGKPQFQNQAVNNQLSIETPVNTVMPKKTLQLKNGLQSVGGRNSLLRKRARNISARRHPGLSRSQKSGQPRIFHCHLESCGKIFHDRASLKKHLTVHGDKLFQCTHEGCGKKFLDNAKLKRHMLVHTGEKPYSCELCGKRFSLDFNLKTHLRIHTGEKPFSCSYKSCHKRFNQKSNLHAHMLTHHLQDPNGELLFPHSRSNSFNDKCISKRDMDDSYSSDKQRQSKIEKMELEITRMLEKHDGKLFIIKQEKYAYSKDEGKSDIYSQEGSVLEDMNHINFHCYKPEKPIFRISYKPRKHCQPHTRCSLPIYNEDSEDLPSLALEKRKSRASMSSRRHNSSFRKSFTKQELGKLPLEAQQNNDQFFYNSETELCEQELSKAGAPQVKCESANTCDYNDEGQVGIKSE